MAVPIVPNPRNAYACQSADPIPKSPTYTFANKLQSSQFTAGVLAALKRIADMQEDIAGADEIKLTEALYAHLLPLLAKGADFASGTLAVVCNYIVSCFSNGAPAIDVWTPFQRCWEGDEYQIPPDDCMFFDVGGVPYSVEPSLATVEWYSEDGGFACNVDEIRGRAKPITRGEFEALRRKAGAWHALARPGNVSALHH